MSKRAKKRSGTPRLTPASRKSSPAAPNPVQPNTTYESLPDDIRQVHEAAQATGSGDGHNVSLPASLSPEELAELYKMAESARKTFAQLTDELSQERQQVAVRLSDIEAKERALAKREEELAGKEKALTEQELELQERELNAQLGFREQHRQVLDEISRQMSEYERKLSNSSEQISSSRLQLLEEFSQRLSDWEESERARITQIFENRLEDLRNRQAELDRERQQLDRERAELQAERREVALQTLQVSAQLELYNQKLEAIEDEIERRVNDAYGGLRTELKFWQDTAQQLSDENKKLQEELASWRKLVIHVSGNLEGKDPALLLNRFRELEQERDRLRRQLDNVPDASQLAELTELRDRYDQMARELDDKTRAVSELKVKLSDARIAAIEVEKLRDEIAALETTRNVLRQHLDELKAEVNQRIGDRQASSPFPVCYSMDQDRRFEQALDVTGVNDLKSFTQNVRRAIAAKEFYYSEKDIRSFVAGLSMSWMTILQGISGTGKSSLPRLFAEAVGGECVVIEVQAGWRDRNDILGYYNAFQERFYESALLQGLYRAQLPRYRDRIFLILLDEMNLSFPEQYFADFLSAMEARPRGRIKLIPYPEGKAIPQYFTREQGELCVVVPENVWFVGTANQDETTKDIADKTYDRSHVIELPTHYEKFNNSQGGALKVISQKSLRDAFSQAKNAHSAEAQKVVAFFDHIRDEFTESLRIGWGNRLTEQISNYVPVVCAAGGDWKEALDRILTTKVLRKARDRYEISDKDLQNALLAISIALSDHLGQKVEPEQVGDHLPEAFGLVEQERRKKGRDEQGE